MRALLMWLHILAGVVALGGGIFINFILAPAAAALQPGERLGLQARVIRRFQPTVLICLLALILTGILFLASVFSIPGYGADVSYMRLLTGKLILVAVVLVLSLYQYFRLGLPLATLAEDPSAADKAAKAQPLARRMVLVARVNIALVAIIFYLAVRMTRG